nr:hypothetical protein [Sahlingia subintegra]
MVRERIRHGIQSDIDQAGQTFRSAAPFLFRILWGGQLTVSLVFFARRMLVNHLADRRFSTQIRPATASQSLGEQGGVPVEDLNSLTNPLFRFVDMADSFSENVDSVDSGIRNLFGLTPQNRTARIDILFMIFYLVLLYVSIYIIVKGFLFTVNKFKNLL